MSFILNEHQLNTGLASILIYVVRIIALNSMRFVVSIGCAQIFAKTFRSAICGAQETAKQRKPVGYIFR